MRSTKILYLVLAGVLGSTTWSGAPAQELNAVGVYADEQMSAVTAAAESGDILTVYVILDDPQNPHLGDRGDEAVGNIGCYSFTLDLTANLELVDKAARPVHPDCTGVCFEYRYCYGTLVPVGGNRHITLKSFQLRYLGSGPGEIRLRYPTVDVIEGEMDFWYRDAELTGWILPMYPASGSSDLPVFVVTEGQVPTTEESWGTLKSTYR